MFKLRLEKANKGEIKVPSSNPFDQQMPISNIKYIIAVGSGKGGVGKSTVAVNFALALSKKHKVGLLDADIYGPSIPRMLGALNQSPEVDAEDQLLPLQRQGLKLMSIGFLVDEEAAVIWRGPMLFKALDQFLHKTKWGSLDFLIIDLPPGTGDIQLSLAQKVPLAGVVVVSTPQNISLVDVKKAVNMFEQVNVPVLGLVENMSYLQRGEERIQLFPKGELDQYLQKNNIKKIAEIPFDPRVSLSGEVGIPVVVSDPESPEGLAFLQMAESITDKLK